QNDGMVLDIYRERCEIFRQHFIETVLADDAPGTTDFGIEIDLQRIHRYLSRLRGFIGVRYRRPCPRQNPVMALDSQRRCTEYRHMIISFHAIAAAAIARAHARAITRCCALENPD